MSYCRDTSLVKRLADHREVQPLKCKCWHCELCAPDRQKDLRGLARRGEPNKFLTLTVNPGRYSGPTERAQQLRHAWLLLRRRLRRTRRWRSIPFLAVFERTKRGEAHLHIMLRTPFISQRWISRVMDELIGAPVVDIKMIRDKRRVAAYVAKYIGKDPWKWDGCKRYWRSQDYELAKHKYVPPEQDLGVWWDVVASSPYVIATMAKTAGEYVVFANGKYFLYPNGPPP